MKTFDQRRSSRVNDLNITETNRYFYLKQTPSDETGKLFYRDGFEGKETLLFDPKSTIPRVKQKYVISSHYPSNDGTTIALEVAPNGSESSELMILDVAKKTFYPEKSIVAGLQGCSWLPDGKSFLYNRLQSADVHNMNREKDRKVYLHIVGQDAPKDKEIFSRAHNPELDIKPEEFDSGYDIDAGYIFAYASTVDNRTKAWYAPVAELKDKIAWKKLCKEKMKRIASTLRNQGNIFPHAERRTAIQVKKFAIQDLNLSKATVVVPEFADRSIEQVNLTKDGLYFTTSKNGVTASLYRVPFATSKAEEIQLPIAVGSAYVTTRGLMFSDVWVGMGGWTQEGKRYRL